MVVGLVGCGAMGSALGARLRAGGARVLVSLDSRSDRTRRLAHAAGLEDVGTLEALAREAEVVLSVVPPGSAVEVAALLADAVGDARPLVADLNAIAPETARQVAAVLAERGIDVVDGSISGPPPSVPGGTRVYLSGQRAAEIAALPLEGVERVVVGAEVGHASAVKMCTASVYKGRVALLTQALRAAHAYGVVEHVLDDLVDSGLAHPTATGATLARASTKAWRYVPEMEEIARAQKAAGLPEELFAALAVVYADLAATAFPGNPEEVADDVSLDEVLARFAATGDPPR